MSDNIRPTLAVMAAGLGQRYEGLKQIVPINGYLLLEYSIFDALGEGFDKAIVLIRKNLENDFRRYLDRITEGTKKNATIGYAYQPSVEELKKTYPFREKMWGTGHAVLCFKDKVKEPFAVINADNLYARESFKSLCEFFTNDSYNPNGNVHALVGYRLKNVVHSQKPVAEAICTISPDGFLESIIERTEIMKRGDAFVYRDETKKEHHLDPDSIVSATQWGFNPTIFPYLKTGFEEFLGGVKQNEDTKKEFYIPDIVNELIAKHGIKVKVLPTEEQCFGMTYKEEKGLVQTEIQKLINKGEYPNKLWNVKIE